MEVLLDLCNWAVYKSIPFTLVVSGGIWSPGVPCDNPIPVAEYRKRLTGVSYRYSLVFQ